MIDTNVGYEKQEPITFWREKLEDGTFYHSKSSGTQPFAKNNDFLKTFKHYKHYHDWSMLKFCYVIFLDELIIQFSLFSFYIKRFLSII